jgi:hypothetical protein
MGDDEKFAELQANLHAAIQEAVRSHQQEACYLTRFVVLAEIVDAEGKRVVTQVAADGMMAWDTLGLLDLARATELDALRQAE